MASKFATLSSRRKLILATLIVVVVVLAALAGSFIHPAFVSWEGPG